MDVSGDSYHSTMVSSVTNFPSVEINVNGDDRRKQHDQRTHGEVNPAGIYSSITEDWNANSRRKGIVRVGAGTLHSVRCENVFLK